MKLLLLDIETSPHISYTWGTWNQYVAPSQLKEHGRTLCWAAKWYGEDEIECVTERAGRKRMVKRIHKLMSEADVVITYNGLKFDIPMLNNEFIKYDLDPVPPQKHIDLYRTARGRLKLASNKLEFVAKYLKAGAKAETGGFELWVNVLAGDDKAWDTMIAYNTQDVALLEKVYEKLRPWVRNHPDVAVNEDRPHCSHCGATRIQYRGYRYTKEFKIERIQCQECGSWGDGAKTKKKKVKE